MQNDVSLVKTRLRLSLLEKWETRQKSNAWKIGKSPFSKLHLFLLSFSFCFSYYFVVFLNPLTFILDCPSIFDSCKLSQNKLRNTTIEKWVESRFVSEKNLITISVILCHRDERVR